MSHTTTADFLDFGMDAMHGTKQGETSPAPNTSSSPERVTTVKGLREGVSVQFQVKGTPASAAGEANRLGVKVVSVRLAATQDATKTTTTEPARPTFAMTVRAMLRKVAALLGLSS